MRVSPKKVSTKAPPNTKQRVPSAASVGTDSRTTAQARLKGRTATPEQTRSTSPRAARAGHPRPKAKSVASKNPSFVDTTLSTTVDTTSDTIADKNEVTIEEPNLKRTDSDPDAIAMDDTNVDIPNLGLTALARLEDSDVEALARSLLAARGESIDETFVSDIPGAMDVALRLSAKLQEMSETNLFDCDKSKTNLCRRDVGKSDSPADALLGDESCVEIDVDLVSTDSEMFSQAPAEVVVESVADVTLSGSGESDLEPDTAMRPRRHLGDLTLRSSSSVNECVDEATTHRSTSDVMQVLQPTSVYHVADTSTSELAGQSFLAAVPAIPAVTEPSVQVQEQTVEVVDSARMTCLESTSTLASIPPTAPDGPPLIQDGPPMVTMSHQNFYSTPPGVCDGQAKPRFVPAEHSARFVPLRGHTASQGFVGTWSVPGHMVSGEAVLWSSAQARSGANTPRMPMDRVLDSSQTSPGQSPLPWTWTRGPHGLVQSHTTTMPVGALGSARCLMPQRSSLVMPQGGSTPNQCQRSAVVTSPQGAGRLPRAASCASHASTPSGAVPVTASIACEKPSLSHVPAVVGSATPSGPSSSWCFQTALMAC